MKLGVIMDPIDGINVKKDSTFAMLLAAQSRGWEIYYMEQKNLFMDNNIAMAEMRSLQVQDNPEDWFELKQPAIKRLSDLEVILMRKDPPFDLNYIYTTYILESAEQTGCLVVNKPASLRDANEKFFITHFRDCIAPTLISRDSERLFEFIEEHELTIVKPLDGMGGQGIYKVSESDPNKKAIIESITNNGSDFIMAQQYIPEISAGDKRILLINGEAIPYALARIPAEGEIRGNLAQGGTGKGVELSERDHWICEKISPRLKEMGLVFVGIDVIGDYLTEINVTSPTCIRELESLYNVDIAGRLIDELARLKQEN